MQNRTQTANEDTHKPRVHTKHDNMKAHSQCKTQAAWHTAQDITWMHAADKNTNCVQKHKTRRQESARSSTLEAAHSHENRTRGEYQGSVTKPRINYTEVTEPWHLYDAFNMSAAAGKWSFQRSGVLVNLYYWIIVILPEWREDAAIVYYCCV